MAPQLYTRVFLRGFIKVQKIRVRIKSLSYIYKTEAMIF